CTAVSGGDRTWTVRYRLLHRNCVPCVKSSKPAARLNRLSAISGHRRSFAGTRRERSRKIKKPLLKLVKQDLKNFLYLIGDCRPTLDPDSLRLDLRKLERCEAMDYLFLVRREKSYLFPVAEVYVPEQYAYLC